MSQDALFLAATTAAADCGCSREQMQAGLKAIMAEHEKNNVWPKGF